MAAFVDLGSAKFLWLGKVLFENSFSQDSEVEIKISLEIKLLSWNKNVLHHVSQYQLHLYILSKVLHRIVQQFPRQNAGLTALEVSERDMSVI